MENKIENNVVVAVLLATYNQEKYIGAALNSVVTQDYRPLRIVICDDGSTDKTIKKAEQLISSLGITSRGIDFVFDISEKNMGIVHNVNKIFLHLLDCKYMVLFAGDDLMSKNRIAAQVTHLEGNPNAVASLGMVEIFGEHMAPIIYTARLFKKNVTLTKALIAQNHTPSSALMVNLDKARNIQFDRRLFMVNDWLYFLEILELGKIESLPQVVVRYRRHEQNTTRPGLACSYLVDRLISTDIFLSKYRKGYFRLRWARANMLYAFAKRAFLDRHYLLSFRFSIYSFFECPLFVKSLAMMFLSCFGRVSYFFVSKLRGGNK
jgi:glycosyltransferase involved in cell wall biosynthesis